MLTEFCVYTIASKDRLDPAALEHTPFVNQESRTWKAAAELLAEAANSGRKLPVLFADAKDCSRLLYWGFVESISLLDRKTEYRVDQLRALHGRHSPQELVLRSTGKLIAPGFIRPYAICATPRFLESDVEGPVLAPDEGPSEGTLVEGATIQVTVNPFERNPVARRRCIAHFGCKCFTCGLDFAVKYGEIGVGFIEVHHLNPLSEISGEYEVDPIRDLRPLCPNCHAIIHRKQPLLTVADVRRLIESAAAERQVVGPK